MENPDNVYTPNWEDLNKGIGKTLVRDGFAMVPENPGLGIKLIEVVVMEHLKEGEKLFKTAGEWNKRDSWNRTWSCMENQKFWVTINGNIL